LFAETKTLCVFPGACFQFIHIRIGLMGEQKLEGHLDQRSSASVNLLKSPRFARDDNKGNASI